MRHMMIWGMGALITMLGQSGLQADDLKSTDKVSAAMVMSSPVLVSLKMVPRGAAVLTSSGLLNEQGMAHIIHAAPGAMSPPKNSANPKLFEPTLESIAASVANSLALAKSAQIKKVAIPLLGGGIWLERIGKTPEQLAQAIVSAAVAHRGEVEVVLVGYSDADYHAFQKAVKPGTAGVSVVQGDITKPNVHGAAAIVNAANMEVVFGGGLSHAIGEASGKKDEINAEARLAMEQFWHAQKP